MILVALFTYIPLASANGDLSINYRFGVDNRIAPNETIPVFVDITNNGNDFSGDFVYDNEELYAGGTGVVLPFEVANGETVQLKFFIHGLEDNYIDAKMIREKTHVYEGSIEKGKKVSIDLTDVKSPKLLAYEAQRLLIISENVEQEKNIKAIDDSKITAIEIAHATKDNTARLSSNRKDFDMYKVILIDESGLKLLTDDTLKAIEQWARQGGTLLLTGNISHQTLPEVLTINGKDVTVKNSSSTPLTLKTGATVATLIYGSGEIIHASQGFDNEAFAKDPQVQNLMVNALKQNFKEDYETDQAYAAANWVDLNGYFETFYYNTNLILLFLIVYIAIVGPLLYIYLKKKDKREKMWLYIPIIAVIASVILFAFGASDRLVKPQTQTMELVSLNGAGDAKVDTAYSFVSNKRGDYKITAPTDVNVAAYLGNFNSSSNDIHRQAYTTFTDNEQTLTLRKVPYWSVEGAVASSVKQDVGSIIQQLTLSNNRLTGSIKNELQVDLKHVQLISGRNIVDLGDIKAGETLKVDQEVSFSTIVKPDYIDVYNVNAAYDNVNDKERMETDKKIRLMQSAIVLNGNNSPILVAQASNSFSTLTLTREHDEKKLMSLVTQKANIEMIFDGEFTLSSNEFSPTLTAVNPNNYSELYNEEQLYGNIMEGDYILQYELLNNILSKDIDWSNLEVTYYDQELDVSIFNYHTNDYEPLPSSPWRIKDDAKHYIDENIIKLKISTYPEYYGQMLTMPTFKLKGEAK